MNTGSTIPGNQTGTTANNFSTPLDPNFYSIDGQIEDWRMKFPISMLRIGRILLKNTGEVMNVSETRVSRLMAKHRNEVCEYGPLQIREELHKYPCEIRGGGIKIEWMENLHKPYRTVPHYDCTFSRIYTSD
jgi:hypothetical protein